MVTQTQKPDNDQPKKLLIAIVIIAINVIYSHIFILLTSYLQIFWKIIENGFLRFVIVFAIGGTICSPIIISNTFLIDKMVKKAGNKIWYLLPIIGVILGFIFYFNFTHQVTNIW